MTHHFTIDVEEYFHPTALASCYPMAKWATLERRTPAVMRRLLDFLQERGVTATCFILGWLAQQEPDMVRAIVKGGHEVASHGWEHELVGRLGPAGFRASVRDSKCLLEDLSGQEVQGYRAPSFSIIPGLEWAFDILLEEQYAYDASLFPIRRHPTYGYPDAERYPYWIRRPSGLLAEIPATTVKFWGGTVPASGGAYFRLLPYGLVRAGFRQAAAIGAQATFYIHPWELDDWAPKVATTRLRRLRTFGGRRRIWPRLARLMDEFRFGPIRETVEGMRINSTR